jgi:hypothetical protein
VILAFTALALIFAVVAAFASGCAVVLVWVAAAVRASELRLAWVRELPVCELPVAVGCEAAPHALSAAAATTAASATFGIRAAALMA